MEEGRKEEERWEDRRNGGAEEWRNGSRP